MGLRPWNVSNCPQCHVLQDQITSCVSRALQSSTGHSKQAPAILKLYQNSRALARSQLLAGQTNAYVDMIHLPQLL